jgi:hypothetical protein
VKLEALKNGQEAPSWLQVFNERVNWLQQESIEAPKFKERGYLEKSVNTPQGVIHKNIHSLILLNIF